jgi:hypothetical protein
MTSTGSPYTATGACSCPTRWTHSVRADLTLKPCTCGRQRIPRDLLIDMNRLGMLSEIVEPGEAPGAVALKGALAGVLANVASQMLTAGEAQVAWREIGAEEALALFLFGGRGVTPQILVVIGIILLSLGVLHRFVGHRGRADMGDGRAG